MPIGGRVGVHWYVISFSIGFGSNATPAPALDWLNNGVFVSVAGRQAAAVVYETYLVE